MLYVIYYVIYMFVYYVCYNVTFLKSKNILQNLKQSYVI